MGIFVQGPGVNWSSRRSTCSNFYLSISGSWIKYSYWVWTHPDGGPPATYLSLQTQKLQENSSNFAKWADMHRRNTQLSIKLKIFGFVLCWNLFCGTAVQKFPKVVAFPHNCKCFSHFWSKWDPLSRELKCPGLGRTGAQNTQKWDESR